MMNSNENTFPEHAFQDYMAILYRGKWIILAVFLIVFSSAIAYLILADPVYKATSKVLVNTRFMESSPIIDLFIKGGSEKNIAQNEEEILKSKSLAKEVAQQLINRKYADTTTKKIILIIQPANDQATSDSVASLDQIAGRLASSVNFEVLPATDIVTINALSKDAQEAALIANIFAEAYYNRNISASRAKSRAFREFLETQVKDKRQSLTTAEDSLKLYMQQHGIVSLDEESKRLIEQLARLEAQRDEIEISIQSQKKTLLSYQEQLPDQEKNIAKVISEANDPYIRLLQEQLAQLEVQRDMTIAQNLSYAGKEVYSDKLKETDDQISSLRSKLQKRTDEFLQSLLPGWQEGVDQKDPAGYLRVIKQKIINSQVEIQTLQVKEETLNKIIKQYNYQFAQIPSKNIEFARLQRAKLSNEKLYLAIQEKYNEATISEQSEFGYLEVIDEATVPNHPSSPKVVLIVLLGVVLGISLSIAIVFIRERLNARVQTPEELKKHKFSVIGTIMRYDEKIKVDGGFPLCSLVGPFSLFAESFRHLRTSLSYTKRDHPLKSVLITSAKPGEGKSTVASNLAITFSQAGKKVLLIDADLRRPVMYKYFKINIAPGLSDFLRGTASFADVLQKSGGENLDIIVGGADSSNPAELLGSVQMQQFISKMELQYDLIILDSSPILAGTDPTILSTVAQEVIVVVSAGETYYSELQYATESLTQIRGRMPVIVLNNFNIHRAYGLLYNYSGFGYYHHSPKQ